MNGLRLLSVLVLNGPNLNLLGQREPHIYGGASLADIEISCTERAAALGLTCEFYQSNHEGDLIDRLQDADQNKDGILFNPGAYGHSSIALLDCIRAISVPVIEVHLSNIFAREDFRHFSYVSRGAKGVICGLGKTGYLLGLEALSDLLHRKDIRK